MFTENQKIIGGVPIYVDLDCRDKVIPVAKQQVEKLVAEVKRLDKYVPSSGDNFYVEEVKKAREAESKARAQKATSFFDERP